jgi:hypothetical protein
MAPTIQAKLFSVWYRDSHDVLRDRHPHVQYLGYWRDWDLNGSATNFAGGDLRDPICYTIDTPVEIAAVNLAVTPANGFTLQHGTIIGSVGGQDVFTGTNLGSQTIGNNWIVYSTNVAGSFSGAEVLALWTDFSISWRLVVSNGVAPPQTYQAGTSSNHVHFMLDDPPGGSFALYYTYIDLACRGGAGNDGSNHETLATAIFAEFGDRVVYRAQDILENVANPQPLTYYGDWETDVTQPGDLLEVGDGQCGSWATFFIFCLWAAGIDPPNERITFVYDLPPQISGAGAMMIVNNWQFTTMSNPDKSTQGDYPHINIPVLPFSFDDFIDGNEYIFEFEDVLDVPGVAGQGGVANPQSLFGNHQVVVVGETIFDPSYGTTYSTGGQTGDAMLAQIDNAMAGYLLAFVVTADLNINELELSIDLNGDTFVTDVWVDVPAHVFQSNPAGNQLGHVAGSPFNPVRP